jgi:hypothetical protein
VIFPSAQQFIYYYADLKKINIKGFCRQGAYDRALLAILRSWLEFVSEHSLHIPK